VTRRLVVEADGGSRGNPGPAGYGALVTDAQTGEVLAEVCDSLGTTTNNVAEYSGLVAGLRAAGDLAPGADVQVRMDSKLVVEQMSGRWQIKDPNLRTLAAAARQAASRLGRISYTWVPRARNTRADKLANQAMDAAAGSEGGRRGARSRGAGDAAADDEAGGAAGRPAATSGSAGTAGAAAGRQDGQGRGWGPPRGQATTTLLLRHGQTPLSAERRFAGRGDVPLTDVGRRQAAAAAARLGARGGIEVIVTSPLRRTRRTAEAIAETTGAPVIVNDDLVEADFGKWEGMTFAEAGAQFPDEMTAWLAGADAAPPGGESFAAAARRVLGALDRLLAAHPDRTLVLVSHVTPIKTLLCRALLAPPAALFRIHLDVASLCEVDWFPDGPALVRSVNDTAHLR
jgi:broad specificity phosphatase PhoE/ribonuclease HI